MLNMMSNPLTVHLSGLSTPTVDEWEAARGFALLNLSPNPTRSQRNRFNFLAGCMLLMTLFYSINLLGVLIEKKLWLFKTDKAGYWHPNIHTVTPILFCIMGSLLATSIMLQNGDYHKYLRESTMLTQLLSYHFLYFSSVTHTWRILVALPSTPFHLRHASILQRPPISPRAFNICICVLYLGFPLVLLPLQIFMVKASVIVGTQWFQIMPTLHELIESEDQMSQTQRQDLNQLAMTMLRSLQISVVRVSLLWRVAASMYTLSLAIQLAVFTYASTRLVMVLGKQVKIIGDAKAHLAQLANLNSNPTLESPSGFSPSGHTAQRGEPSKPIHWIWMWTSLDFEFVPRVWHDPNLNGISDNELHFRRLDDKHKVVTRYRHVIAFQSASIGAIIMSYGFLTALLTTNAFRAGDRTPVIEVALITHEWGDWAVGVPGVLLSILACCITFMPCLSGRVYDDGSEDFVPGSQDSSEVESITGMLRTCGAGGTKTYCLNFFRRLSKTSTSAPLSSEAKQSNPSSIFHCLAWHRTHLKRCTPTQSSTNDQHQSVVIDISDGRNPEFPETIDDSIAKGYASDEKGYGENLAPRNSSYMDVIRLLRAKDEGNIKAHQTYDAVAKPEPAARASSPQ